MKGLLVLMYVAILLVSVSNTYALTDDMLENSVELVYTEVKGEVATDLTIVEVYKGEKVDEVPLKLECNLNVINENKELSYHVSEHDVRHFDRRCDSVKNKVSTINNYKDLPLLIPLT